MNKPTVCANTRTIKVSKQFAASSSRYGTPEYDILQNVRRDYPGFSVVVAARKAPKASYKGLTYEYMENYIRSHEDSNAIMGEYMNLRAMTDEANEACASSLSYQEIKTWFLDKYPTITKFHETRAKLVNDAQKKKADSRKSLLQKQMEARRNALKKMPA